MTAFFNATNNRCDQKSTAFSLRDAAKGVKGLVLLAVPVLPSKYPFNNLDCALTICHLVVSSPGDANICDSII